MATASNRTPIEYLKAASPATAEAFQALRKAVLSAGPLDAHTCELITLGSFVPAGNEPSFKVHARRLLKDGVSDAALRQAVLVTFGATATFADIVGALRWIDDVTGEGPNS